MKCSTLFNNVLLISIRLDINTLRKTITENTNDKYILSLPVSKYKKVI